MAGELQVKLAWTGRTRSLRTRRQVAPPEVTAQPRIYSGAMTETPAPKQPRDPNALHQRNIRVSDALWTAAQAKASEGGENVSDVVRRLLEGYVAQP